MSSTYVLYYTVMVSKSRMFADYVAGYDYSTLPPTEIIQNDVVIPETILSGDISSYTATDLEPDTAYYFKFTACNSAGCHSIIAGPVKTSKLADTGEGVLSATYRQDPITGLVRIWWNQNIVPDKTVITLTPLDAYAGTYSITEYKKNYTVQSFVRGEYLVTLRNFIEETMVASTMFVMTVHDYRLCDGFDLWHESDQVSLRCDTVPVDFVDALNMTDDVPHDLVVTVTADLSSGGFIRDEAEHGGTTSIYIDGVSAVRLFDVSSLNQNAAVLVDLNEETFLSDHVVDVVGDVAYIPVNDIHALGDHLAIRTDTALALAVDATMFAQGSETPGSVILKDTDSVAFNDRSQLAMSVTLTPIELLNLWDTPIIPEINDAVSREPMRVGDVAEDSSVGAYYDFSHVRGS